MKTFLWSLTAQDFCVGAVDGRAEVNAITLLPHFYLQGVTWVDRLGEPDFNGLEKGRVVVCILLDDRANRNTESCKTVNDWSAENIKVVTSFVLEFSLFLT